MRFTLVLLSALVLAGCGDDAAGPGPVPEPGTYALEVDFDTAATEGVPDFATGRLVLTLEVAAPVGDTAFSIVESRRVSGGDVHAPAVPAGRIPASGAPDLWRLEISHDPGPPRTYYVVYLGADAGFSCEFGAAVRKQAAGNLNDVWRASRCRIEPVTP